MLIAGHPAAVDCMVAVDDETIVTGAADGIIRLMTIQVVLLCLQYTGRQVSSPAFVDVGSICCAKWPAVRWSQAR